MLPYREIDQSGVLFTALAFGAPLLLSDVGGFPEIAAHGAAALVAPGDAEALRASCGELLGDDAARAAPRRGARVAPRRALLVGRDRRGAPGALRDAALSARRQ